MSPADREASLKCMSPKVRAAMTRALAPATGNDQPSSQKAFCALLAGLRPDLFQATASKNYLVTRANCVISSVGFVHMHFRT